MASLGKGAASLKRPTGDTSFAFECSVSVDPEMDFKLGLSATDTQGLLHNI